MAAEAGQKAWVKHINYWKKAQPYVKYIEQELDALDEHESEEDFERYQFLQVADVSHTQVMIEREYESLYALAAKAQK